MTVFSSMAFEPIGLHEGTIGLPAGFTDRTANLFVPADPQKLPNLSVARDWLEAEESLSSYVDRQLQVLKSRLPNHKLVARAAEQLGQGTAVLLGERIDAQYKDGKGIVRQRQAAFLVAPKRVLILTAASAHTFDECFENLWRSWLDTFVLAPVAAADVTSPPQ